MNGIIGMTELLSNTSLEEDQRSFVDMIEQSAQALLRIINDILDFSKIEAGKLELESIDFDLRTCLKQMARSLAVRAAQKSLELVLEIASDVPQRITGDPDRLRQILVNLVGNGIKFTAKGEIRVLVQVDETPKDESITTLHFSVKDTGIGIPREKCQSIFEAFSQADRSTTRQFGGTGLGLSISSQIVEMMGGRIWLESAQGLGSTFHFTAKFDTASPPGPDEKWPQDLPHSPLVIITADRTGMQILEDDLKNQKFRAHVCSDIASARTWLDEQAPHVDQEPQLAAGKKKSIGAIVLVDPASPQGNLGDSPFVHQLHELRSALQQRNPFMILATSLTEQLPRSELHAYGFDASVYRPVFLEEVAKAIQRAGQGELEPRRRRNSSKACSGCKFLLAEDGQVNRAVFVGLLQGDGHEVITVENGEQAVEAWRDEAFDAILMDVQMPVMDGLEATRRIRREELKSKQRIPVIALTAGAMDSDRQQCEAAGMDFFVSKPVDSEHLRSVIEQIRRPQSAPGTSEQAKAASDAIATNQVWNVAAPLKQFNYSPEQLRTLAATMRAEVIQRTAEIVTAVEEDDLQLLTRAAHTLKSAAGLFDAHTLHNIAQAIEDFARVGEANEIPALVEQLQSAAEDVKKQIDAWLDKPT
jgi:CheY-like chemotaxis protein